MLLPVLLACIASFQAEMCVNGSRLIDEERSLCHVLQGMKRVGCTFFNAIGSMLRGWYPKFAVQNSRKCPHLFLISTNMGRRDFPQVAETKLSHRLANEHRNSQVK